MQNVIQCIKDKKREFTDKVQKNAHSFIYREQRYHVPFAISIFYCNEGLHIDPKVFQRSMRTTDKLIVLNTHIWCIYFDNIVSPYHVKATENICFQLVQQNDNKKVYAATVSSQEFEHEYRKISNTLFERVQYSLHSKSNDMVIDQDYEI